MVFSTSSLSEAMSTMAYSYYDKILKVDFNTNSFVPIKVNDEEWYAFHPSKPYKLTDWLEFFLSSGLCNFEDRQEFLRIMDIETLKHIQETVSFKYNKKIDNVFHLVRMEILPKKDEPGIAYLFVKEATEMEAQEMEEYNKLQTYAFTDALTGFNNQIKYLKDIKLNNYRTLIFVDANGLKYFNDNYGHQEGNRLLKDIANVLLDFFPREEIYRIGGDEFVILSQMRAADKPKALRKALWDKEIPLAAIGWNQDSRLSNDKKFKEAEKYMYKDKNLFYELYPKYRRN